jgi:uncharacterized protein
LTKHDFYRYCRWVHGWLSALAFVALSFFAFTGLTLNHPDWLGNRPDPVKQSFTLTTSEIAQLRATAEPAQALVKAAAEKIALKGQLGEGVDGDVVGNELFVRMQGVRGTSFLSADLRTGAVDVTIEAASTLSVLNELHRAERAGKSWRWVVDVIAILLLALSLIGYLIFLSMRGARLRTAVLLTVGSTFGLWFVFVYSVG